MIIGVLKETRPGERRVALVPDVAPALAKKGIEVLVETGAGREAGFPDTAFEAKGARIASSRAEVLQAADVIAQIHADFEPGLRSGQFLVGMLDPWGNPEKLRALASAGISAFALELMPRITRAQSMDVLSSMATIAGYKAVLMAGAALPKVFPLMTTAAGTLLPGHVFVIGAGVAGLQAIATAKRLGAVVEAYDVRPAVKEQVQSVGGKFVDLPLETGDAEDAGGYARSKEESFYQRQRELLHRVVASSDVVITTAAIPGKPAPVLIDAGMVEAMALGSVIVDLAAERGGNCALSRPGETIVHGGVTIMAPLNLPATVPHHASQMFGRNVSTFLQHLVKDGRIELAGDDPIAAGTLVTQGGEVVHPAFRELVSPPLEKP